MAAPTRSQQAGAAAALVAAIALAAPATKKFEGLVNDPYWDIARVRSVCYGETHNVEERHYTTAECDAMLMKSLAKHGSEVQHCLPADVPVPVLAAFADFAYNLGTPNACASSAAKAARAGNYRAACAGLLPWNKVRKNGVLVVSSWQVKRRAWENDLCLRGVGP